MIRICLPWPPRELSPNARLHWAARNKHRKRERESAFWTTVGVTRGRKLGFEQAAVRIEFSPPDRRKRDLDNMLASCKAALDGVADAIGIDDSQWSITLHRAEDCAGEVRLCIGAAA